MPGVVDVFPLADPERPGSKFSPELKSNRAKEMFLSVQEKRTRRIFEGSPEKAIRSRLSVKCSVVGHARRFTYVGDGGEGTGGGLAVRLSAQGPRASQARHRKETSPPLAATANAFPKSRLLAMPSSLLLQ